MEWASSGALLSKCLVVCLPQYLIFGLFDCLFCRYSYKSIDVDRNHSISINCTHLFWQDALEQSFRLYDRTQCLLVFDSPRNPHFLHTPVHSRLVWTIFKINKTVPRFDPRKDRVDSPRKSFLSHSRSSPPRQPIFDPGELGQCDMSRLFSISLLLPVNLDFLVPYYL